MRTPLIVRYPRLVPGGTVVDGPVRSVDLLPTILDTLGLPGAESTQGRSLLPALRGRAQLSAVPQYLESMLSEVGFGMAPLQGVKLDGLKWIRAPKPELYDLTRDPKELQNLYPAASGPAARLNRMLDDVLSDSKACGLTPRTNPLDQETLEALQALGYLAPASERRSMAGLDPKDGIQLYNQLEDARHLAQQEKWPEAEALLRKVLAVTPANVSARNVLALTRLRQDDLAGAREEYLRSLADDPGQARVYAQLGALSLLAGQLEEAKRSLNKALTITPGFVEAAGNLGLIAVLEGRAAEAERYYQQALALDPSYHRGYRRLADLFYERRDFAQARVYYEKTLAIQPSDFDARLQAGNSARRSGDLAAAEHHFEVAAALRPDAWQPLYNWACLAAVSGRRDEALGLLAKSVELGLFSRRLVAEDTDLESLHGTPGFESVLKQLED